MRKHGRKVGGRKGLTEGTGVGDITEKGRRERRNGGNEGGKKKGRGRVTIRIGDGRPCRWRSKEGKDDTRIKR